MKKHQVWGATCQVCEEGITNPVCTSCLEKELKAWAFDEAPLLIPVISEIIGETYTSGNELSECIFCGSKINICSYCITGEMLLFLENQIPELVESFMHNFGSHTADYKFDLMAM